MNTLDAAFRAFGPENVGHADEITLRSALTTTVDLAANGAVTITYIENDEKKS